jgi:hypothetical protein
MRLRPLGRIHEHRLEARHRAEARRVAHRPGEADRGGDQDAVSHDRPEEWEAIAACRSTSACRTSRTKPCATPSPPTASTPASTPPERIHHHRDLSQPHRGAKAGGVGPQPSSPASALPLLMTSYASPTRRSRRPGTVGTSSPTVPRSAQTFSLRRLRAPPGKHHLSYCDLRGAA